MFFLAVQYVVPCSYSPAKNVPCPIK